MPGTETGRAPSDVSVRTRLPHSSADWKRRLVTARAVPASAARRCASRICPRICASPRTIESSPEATRKRCRTVASPRPVEGLLAQDGAVDGVETREEAREGLEAVGELADAVDLGPVAGRDDGPLGQDPLAEEPLERLARRLGREGEPRPQVEVRSLVVPADEDDLGRHQVKSGSSRRRG